MSVSFGLNLDFKCVCVKCGVEREMPEGKGRLPARDDDGVTLTADTKCHCGASRVRVMVDFE